MQCLKQRTDLPLQVPCSFRFPPPPPPPAKQEGSVEMEFDKRAGTGKRGLWMPVTFCYSGYKMGNTRGRFLTDSSLVSHIWRVKLRQKILL